MDFSTDLEALPDFEEPNSILSLCDEYVIRTPIILLSACSLPQNQLNVPENNHHHCSIRNDGENESQTDENQLSAPVLDLTCPNESDAFFSTEKLVLNNENSEQNLTKPGVIFLEDLRPDITFFEKTAPISKSQDSSVLVKSDNQCNTSVISFEDTLLSGNSNSSDNIELIRTDNEKMKSIGIEKSKENDCTETSLAVPNILSSGSPDLFENEPEISRGTDISNIRLELSQESDFNLFGNQIRLDIQQELLELDVQEVNNFEELILVCPEIRIVNVEARKAKYLEYFNMKITKPSILSDRQV